MIDYPKWHETAVDGPMRVIHQEIDAIRARLDSAGIPKIPVTETCDSKFADGEIVGSSSLGDGSDYPKYGDDSENAARKRYEAAKAGEPLPWPPAEEPQVKADEEQTS